MPKLIVEMEMPKDCLWYEDGKEGRCPFLDDGDCCRGQSDEANEVAETWSDLQKGCPIKGVLPEQHGDLIDRDRLEYRVMAETNPFGKPTIEYESGIKVMQMIEDAVTVIQAERKAYADN